MRPDADPKDLLGALAELSNACEEFLRTGNGARLDSARERAHAVIAAQPVASGEAQLREALERITSTPPAVGPDGVFYHAHFDGDGNELGTEPVDPLAVVQEMVSIAHNALAGTQPATDRQAVEAGQRARMRERFANRPLTPATEDFDLPAASDSVGPAALAENLRGHTRTLRLSGRNDGMVEDMERAAQALSAQPATSGDEQLREALADPVQWWRQLARAIASELRATSHPLDEET